MIVLDTNVVSEAMRPEPDRRVLAWLGARSPMRLATTAVTIAEIGRGLARLPAGRRKSGLQNRFAAFVEDGFADRILHFDLEAATFYPGVCAAREREGLHADAVDMMIASVVKRAGAKFATRNVKDFEKCGIDLTNPWRAAS